MRVRLSIVLAGVLVIAAAPSALAMTPEERTDPIPVAPRAILSLVAGFALPVDAPLDLRADLLPGAPRAYRGGTHEGVDFLAPYGAPVRAARAGIVLRIDRDYAEWPWTLRAAALASAVQAGATSPELLDRLRGRQVWVGHGNGVVTRYAHLSDVADLLVGDPVVAGDLLGAVGASGYPEGGPHLHLEIRVGDRYLGEGLEVEDVRWLVARAFSPAVIGWRDRE